MLRTRQQRPDVLTEKGFTAERDGVKGGPVKGLPHGEGLEAAGGHPCQFEGHADGAGAARGQENLGISHRGKGREPFAQFDRRSIAVTARAKRQVMHLLDHRLHHPRVAVADLMGAVAVKIEEGSALHIGKAGTRGPGENIEAGRRQALAQKDPLVAFKEAAGGDVDMFFLPLPAMGALIAVTLARAGSGRQGRDGHRMPSSGLSPASRRRLISAMIGRHSQMPAAT